MAEHQIGFVEKFALAPDRDVVLKELIVGTEDYYFYHALHFQNTDRKKELADLLAQWAKRNPDSPMLHQIKNRQALLTYETDPKATLAYLKKALGVEFNHQQETLNPKPNLPTQLDPNLISLESFERSALLDEHNLNASKVTDLGLEYLLTNNVVLTEQQRRALLARMKRPDVPHLLEAVLVDLATKESRGFGEFPIHRQLLVDQLQQLRKARPALMDSTPFVETWLARLKPNADVDMDRDAAVREAWLDATWNFVKDLSPAFNSLKAHVLYQRLVLDQKRGQQNEERFREYLKMPRHMGYVSEKYRQNIDLFRYPANLQEDFSRITSCGPVGNDEPLVRSYLLHFLKTANNDQAFAPFIAHEYLSELFAEAKLINGIGNAEQWFSMLSPSDVQALRSRVDLDFDPTNPEVIAPESAVSLDVFVKNVPKLMVNVFEINTENFYRANGSQIGTDLNLDGLVANKQQSLNYDDAPVLRVKRTFKFDELPARRGVWVVDFIGNGKSSRALIRKGQLHFVTRPSSVGTAVTVLDEKRQPVAKAYALLGTQRYASDEHGEIVIPFSNKPGRQSVILGDGTGFTQLEHLDLQGETYALHAGFHAARESLIAGKKALIAIRPTLTVNGAPIDLSLLEEVKLTIISSNQDAVASSIVKPDLKLFGDKETTVEITVPERLSGLTFNLEGKVKSLITGAKVPLNASHQIYLNQKDNTEYVSDLFLSRIGSNYILQELGRTGEPRSERALVVRVRRPEFGGDHSFHLKTDATGAVMLGTLDGISSIQASNPNGLARFWSLPIDRADVPSNIHVTVGQEIALPWMEGEAKPLSPLVSLLELRNGNFVRSALTEKTASVKAGYLFISGLEAGDYSLRYGSVRKEVTIRVTQGTAASGWLIGNARHLEAKTSAPLQVMGVTKDNTAITFAIENTTKDTRVHLLASRFLPGFDAFADVGSAPDLEPLIGTPGGLRTLYVSGRTLGEEYRYVLERRIAKKFPGSMLQRPGLLLNPWVLRSTETAINEAQMGEEFKRAEDGRSAGMKKQAARMAGGGAVAGYSAGPDISNIDFLADTGLTTFNLVPDKDGKVTVKLADLGDRQFVRVLAVNSSSSVVRDLSLPDAKTKVRDLTLRNGLDPKGHFTRQNQVSILEKNAPFTIKDAVTAKFETQTDLGGIFNLYRTLSNNPTLAEFSFLLEWPTLDAAKKREHYSKYASHELSFFLQRKDPEFFKSVILPYLANKKDKTFMDHYLLGDDLHSYLRPWNYQRLNIVERILLAQRHRDEAAATAREVSDLKDLLPPNVEAMMLLFDTTLAGGEMSGGATEKLGVGSLLADAAPGSLPQNTPVPMASPAAPADAFAAAPAPAESKAVGGFGLAGANAYTGATTISGGIIVTGSSGMAMTDGAKDLNGRMLSIKSGAELSLLEKEEAVGRDKMARREVAKQQLYRKLEPTQEWAENNYYHLPIEQQMAELVSVNGFWKDYALWDGKSGFLSSHVAEASTSFTEMILALAVLDLPFPNAAKQPKAEVKDLSLTLTPTDRMVLFHREIKPAEIDKEAPRLLVSQNFYRNGDRYIDSGNGEKQDKFVSEEFLSGVVYGCQVVVTNPTSSTQKLDLLIQIPQGAIPVLGSKATNSAPLRLESYRTHTMDYFFYFPKAGKFAHHPVHVSKNEKVVAFAEPFTFNVVDELTKLDTGSWDYISQFGKADDVLTFLDQHNIQQLVQDPFRDTHTISLIKLDRMAWRLKDAAFYQKAMELLTKRHVFHSTTWSYAIKHNDPVALRDFLLHRQDFMEQTGAIETKLLTNNPVENYAYQHLEYSPLINARAHRLGADRSILNDRFGEQYQELLNWFSRRVALNDEDRLAVTYYLLLQDRVEEALAMFAKVDATKITEHLQHDYLKAVCALYQEDVATARQIAQANAKHPVDRWREKFTEVLAQLDELEGKKPADVKEDDREQKQNALATTEPTIDFTVENKEVKLAYHNLKEVTVNYYPMDLEFLFSTAPFVGQDTSRFGMIQPNRSERVVLPADRDTHVIALPRDYHSSNVLVEITSAGKTIAHAYYANELNIQVSENYGRLQVLHAKDQRPLSKVYVKVFAEINGQSKFYKDGYTDLRGKFDYLSLSTEEMDQATRFSVLVLSEEFGAAVREVKPPRQ